MPIQLKRGTFIHQPKRLVGILALALALTAARAQNFPPSEYDVKAAYLFNFGKFVSWPGGGGSGGSFPICLLGDDPFGGALDRIVANENIDGNNIIVRRIHEVGEADACRILFISTSEKTRVPELLSSLRRKPILTVGDMGQFAANGGMVQFLLQEKKVRFEVNLQAAERAGLTLSSQLLKVATKVTGRKGPG